MPRTPTEIRVYWDTQGPSESWAYNASDERGLIDSGSLDAAADDLDDAIAETVSILGLELTPDMFAREPRVDGGYAIWDGTPSQDCTRIVTLWYDDTSDEPGYVVDVEDDNGSITVNVFDNCEEAVAFAHQYAKQSGMRFEDRT